MNRQQRSKAKSKKKGRWMYEYWYDDKGRVVGKVPLVDVVGLDEEE
tara:strand:+ start:31464 stop:31601 length:138 start_codon:yes stop_codon:yes gene_type:complete